MEPIITIAKNRGLVLFTFHGTIRPRGNINLFFTCVVKLIEQRWGNVKATVSRDFLLQVFFMRRLTPSSTARHFEFFPRFAEIFESQGAPPVVNVNLRKGNHRQILNGPHFLIRARGEIS